MTYILLYYFYCCNKYMYTNRDEALPLTHTLQVMRCRWSTACDALRVSTAGDALQVMHRRWWTVYDALKLMHWYLIQDKSDIRYDTSDPCSGSVGFDVSNCSGFLVVPPSISESRTDYWVLFTLISLLDCLFGLPLRWVSRCALARSFI